MPAVHKPLFRPDAVRPHLAGFVPSPAATAARPKLTGWATQLSSGKLDKKKETELLPGFLADVFEGVLGYTRPPAAPYTLKREALIQVDGKFADAGLGRFGGGADEFAAVVEGKGPDDPLDRPHKGRKRSAVEQALQYAVQLELDWYLVTNLKETRLLYKGRDTFTFERFDTARVAADDGEFRRFVFLLGADRVVPPGGGANHLDGLLTESVRVGRELTEEFYRDYRGLRERTFAALREHNPGRDPADLLAAAQKILDRVLFIAFCEDRGLMPRDIIAEAYRKNNPFDPGPIWRNFVGLFKAVDEGSPHLNIARYNGGLFAKDAALDSLVVPDDVCDGFRQLAAYEFGPGEAADARPIDVEILGHIFEQSVSDLEALRRQATGGSAVGPGKRKAEGVFYTPAFVTRYIVAETLGPVLADRFSALWSARQADAAKPGRAAVDDPRRFDPAALTPGPRRALVQFWLEWRAALEAVRVVDPACGSGAFLIEAFDQLFAAYTEAEGYLAALGQPANLFEPKKTILTKNLFGVDLNGEAVEIARLSCWIKTAELGKELTSLDDNVLVGDSIAGEPTPHAAWQARFPDAFRAGGFDAVIGNPPYVRQERIAPLKPYLKDHYRAYDGAADLYVYFYELGLRLLKPGGRLGLIVTNKWLKAGYGEPLRRLYADHAWVESVVDLGHNKEVFPDADVFPCILVARKPDAGPPPESARVCAIPRDQFRVDDLSRQASATGFAVPRGRFTADPWSLEPPAVDDLLNKLRRVGVPLREYAGVSPLYGIKTGFNDAYLIDSATRDQLVAADPKSEPLFRKYLRGQDLDRWHSDWAGLWMIALKSSGNHPWPWAGKPEADAEAVFRATYPALYVHFAGHRAALTARQDQGEFWWELRACAYWSNFDRPKVMYQDITWNSRFCLDEGGTLCNNTVYFLPSADSWLLAALNAPISWWFAWRTAQHGKDEALRLFTDYLNGFPIPRPTDELRAEVEASVGRLIALKAERTDGTRAVLDWLRAEFGVDKPSQKLSGLVELAADDLIAEVRNVRGKKAGLSVAEVKRLKDEYVRSVVPLRASAGESERLERGVSDRVNAAFGLTPDEVALMWRTAPPRMPIAPPPG